MIVPILQTPHLRLHGWQESDLEPFSRLNADPRVMAHFPAPLTREQSDELARRIMERMETSAFGLWALELYETGEFIGFTGLSVPSFTAPFTPCIEIGWRLAFEHWGFGYASEAALACLAYGFDALLLDEIVSFTVPANLRSRAVMERIGLTRVVSDDFLYPALSHGHPLQPHVLYRMTQGQWQATRPLASAR